MNKKLDYKAVSMYYLIGNLFNKGISFITVPIFSNLLSTTDYGIATTYASWVAILSTVMGMALHMGVRASFIDYKEKTKDFLSVILTYTVLFSGLFSAVVLVAIVLLKINVDLCLVVLCLVHSFSSAVITDFSMYLMMQYRYKLRTFMMIVPNLLATIFSIIAIVWVLKSDLYMGRIAPQAIVHLLFGIVIVAGVLLSSKVFFKWEYIVYALKISAPLILHSIALNILSQSDRTMITWLASASDTGIYSLIYNFSMIATVITSALEGVWVPWFTQRMKERKIKAINERAVDYVNLMTYCMVCLIFAAPEVVKLLANPAYWQGIVIIPPIVLANYVIFVYTLYVNIEHFYKRTPYITVNTLIAASTNILLNFLFIPQYGYKAAAYTTLVAYVVSLLLHARYAKKLDKDAYPIKMFIRPLIHILIAILLFYQFIESPVFRWGIMIVYLLAMTFRERKKIIELFPFLKKK